MPSSITVEHNNVRMVFNEEDHSYIDERGRRYTSVTSLVSQGFEAFDSERVAKRVALKEGRDWRDIVAEWRETGKMAASQGTRLHENCEMQIRGKLDCMHEPKTPYEQIIFKIAYDEVARLKSDPHLIKFEPEKLVFSPRLLLAGSIDLLGEYDDGWRIYDWKNIKSLSKCGFNGKCGIIEPTSKIEDSNFWHYVLQLNLYEVILKVERYIPKEVEVKKTLKCFIQGHLENVEVPSVLDVAKRMVTWHYEKRMLD